jgi:hypothetical protein
MGRETVDEFVYKGRCIQIDGCWDEQTPEGTYDFYEIWDVTGQPWNQSFCLTEGCEPFYERPSRREIIEFLEELEGGGRQCTKP